MFLTWQNCPQEGGIIPMEHKPVLLSQPPCPWGLLRCVPTVSSQQWGCLRGQSGACFGSARWCQGHCGTQRLGE